MISSLLQPDILARAEALGVAARQVVEGLRVGDHKSPYRGFSVEFVQHREYVPGDDIRHIDWKSYGRSERYTIKQYEQETNYTAHMVVDASNSMRYGEGLTNKLDYAKLLVASLSYVIVKQRDAVTLRLYDNRWRAELPPSSQMNNVNVICKTLEEATPADKSGTGPLFEQLAERVSRKGIICIFTDGFDDVQPMLTGLRHLRFRGHEVILFHILHRDEVEFPLDGNVRFIDLEGVEELMTRPHLLRPAYLRAIDAYLKEMEKGCDAGGVEYVRMLTDKPVRVALGEYLIKRLQRG